MMREMEQVKKQGEKIVGLETELGELKTRYEACLVMLGEKSEEVEELRDDLEEVKKIYREVLLQAGGVGDTK
jgi:predicted RNase H-like nuclease (RuvC/YqgF family)